MHRAGWSSFVFLVGALTLLIGAFTTHLPVELLVLSGAATLAGLNNLLRARSDPTAQPDRVARADREAPTLPPR
ncbi:hypothetical protein ASE16_17785 [Leifsonia sp. Root227]|uniref:hypothetical protein n=1 Tax=unclassified Leifsonia TaxID=2663824 RepID=UPI000701BF3C|nr:hypothetical protein [Leifsonia sp. Root227]KRC47181.1 hypothetical protein ASE16_17785 [Leifsonia sp. Root227]